MIFSVPKSQSVGGWSSDSVWHRAWAGKFPASFFIVFHKTYGDSYL